VRAYLFVTGLLFAVLSIEHLVHLILEGGQRFGTDPWFAWGNVAGILVSGGIAAWAGWLLLGLSRDRGDKSKP
jgi:hypothetical protein